VRRLENPAVRQLPTLCISLPRAARRRELMGQQAAQLGLTRFAFVDAVDGASLDPRRLEAERLYDEAAAIGYHGKPLSNGAIACSLSHGQAYDRIVAEQLPYALVVGRCLKLAPGQQHPFRQRGAPTELNGYVRYPHCVLNGSTWYFGRSTIA
jgi:hypothetical protein